MDYEELLCESHNLGLNVKEKPLQYTDGRISGNRIAIRRSLDTSIEKACILAEEIGHFETSVGNILDQELTDNRKQEYRARMWSYDKLIGLIGLIECYKAGCKSKYDMALHLNVTEEFLEDAINAYTSRYGVYAKVDRYVICFSPLMIMELKL